MAVVDKWINKPSKMAARSNHSRKIMIQNICFTLLLFLAAGINAAEKIKTVDVLSAKKLGDFWGVEFPIEGAEAEPTMGSTLYLDPKGDLVVQFYYSSDISDRGKNRHYLLYHVTQKKILHNEKKILFQRRNAGETEQNRYIQEHNFVQIKPVPIKIDPDDYEYGGVYYLAHGYRWSSRVGGDMCRPPIEGTIRVQDIQKKLIVEKTLLYSSALKKMGHQSSSGCEEEGNGSGRPRKLSTTSLDLSWIWKIDDGTVLLEVSNLPYLIRLTPQLTSQFVEKHPNFQFFKPGVLLPIYEQAFEQHWEKAYQKPDQDVYEIVDEIIFRFVQQNNNRSTALTAQNP